LGGSDTSRGMNFQYACAIEFILELVSNPAWDMVELEGHEDVEDILVVDKSGRVLLRAQIKQKRDPYQWQPSDFGAVMRAFLRCDDYEETRYQFVYAGSEGRSFVRDVRPVLAKLHTEGPTALTADDKAKLSAVLEPDVVPFLLRAGHRVDIIKHDTRGSLKDRSLLRIRRILAQQAPGQLPEGVEDQAYDRLFRVVAETTEREEASDRRLTRAAVLRSLGTDSEVGGRDRLIHPVSPGNLLSLSTPRVPDHFVGRLDMLDSLRDLLVQGTRSGWIALYGLPGIGKTSVARVLVGDEHVRMHYRDGVLWGALGRTPDPFAVLGTWAAELGIPMQELPALTTLEARAQAVRKAIGNRYMLLVVDDVWEVAPALAVAVGGPNCMHLATTRLPPVAEDLAGADAFKVSELGEDESIQLLDALVPQSSHEHDSEKRDLLKLVGHLPLAVTLMGRYLRRQAHHPRRLATAMTKLNEIEVRLRMDQPQAMLDRHPSIPAAMPLSLEAAIQISIDALDEDTRQSLFSLSVIPPKPNTFNEVMALAVTGTTADALDILYDVGLLEIVSSTRYSLHQTIHDFARLHMSGSDAQQRLVEFVNSYLADHEADFDSLDPETSNIFAAIQQAHDSGVDAIYARIVNAAYRFLETRGFYHLIEPHLQSALLAARRAGDDFEYEFALYHLGRATLRLGRSAHAAQYFYKALESAERRGDIHSFINTLGNLSAALIELGADGEAEEWVSYGVSLARKLGDPESIVSMLNVAGATAIQRGDDEAAEDYFRDALQRARDLTSYTGLSPLLANLSTVTSRKGRFQESEELLLAALYEAEANRHHEYILLALGGLVSLKMRQGYFEDADTYLQRLLPLFADTPHALQARPLARCILVVAKACEDSARAIEYLRAAVTLARSAGDGNLVLTALTELGARAAVLGNYEDAEAAFEESFTLAVEYGTHALAPKLLANLGAASANRGGFEFAERCFKMSQTLARACGIKHDECTALLLIARLAVSRNEGDRAIILFEQAIDLALAYGAIDIALAGLGEVGRIALSQGDFQTSRRYWQRALQLTRQREDPPLLTVALIELATVGRQEGRLDEAEQLLVEAAELAERSNLQDLTVVALYHLIEVRLTQGTRHDVEELGDRCFQLLDTLHDAEAGSFRERLAALLAQSGLASNGHGSTIGADYREDLGTGGSVGQ
jgi:tetratricopeptide (TPR) repeat protein